jgi:hypothetical protein
MSQKTNTTPKYQQTWICNNALLLGECPALNCKKHHPAEDAAAVLREVTRTTTLDRPRGAAALCRDYVQNKCKRGTGVMGCTFLHLTLRTHPNDTVVQRLEESMDALGMAESEQMPPSAVPHSITMDITVEPASTPAIATIATYSEVPAAEEPAPMQVADFVAPAIHWESTEPYYRKIFIDLFWDTLPGVPVPPYNRDKGYPLGFASPIWSIRNEITKSKNRYKEALLDWFETMIRDAFKMTDDIFEPIPGEQPPATLEEFCARLAHNLASIDYAVRREPVGDPSRDQLIQNQTVILTLVMRAYFLIWHGTPDYCVREPPESDERFFEWALVARGVSKPRCTAFVPIMDHATFITKHKPSE